MNIISDRRIWIIVPMEAIYHRYEAKRGVRCNPTRWSAETWLYDKIKEERALEILDFGDSYAGDFGLSFRILHKRSDLVIGAYMGQSGWGGANGYRIPFTILNRLVYRDKHMSMMRALRRIGRKHGFKVLTYRGMINFKGFNEERWRWRK